MLHAPRAELSIELGRREAGDLTVVIEQTKCFLVGRFGIGLWQARGQQDQQRDAPVHRSTPLCKVALAQAGVKSFHETIGPD